MSEEYRLEKDSLGEVKVSADKYWGAQTQRSLQMFSIGKEKMPDEIIRALAIVKKAAANANCEFGKLSEEKNKYIREAASEIVDKKLADQFPLYIWQTGSGTQTNMNVNEVIANRAIELAGGKLGSKHPVHPNNDVNMSQSTNDVFPTAMHIAAVDAVNKKLLPVIERLKDSLKTKSEEFSDIVKIGRTHLQDAVPITLGQEFSGYVSQLEKALEDIKDSSKELYKLALGGTAVGTGLNAPNGFSEKAIYYINEFTGYDFQPAENKFSALAAHDEIVRVSSSLRRLAVSLNKIAGDIRWLASGPRCGLGELILPENEPGSSIMPGKVNPTQCEALSMVVTQVIGNDDTIAAAGSQGHFELNVYKPVMIYNLLQSINILAGSCDSFDKYLVKGLKANTKKINNHLNNSLMLVTALNEKIGYDKAAEIAHKAYMEEKTLKESSVELGYLTEKEFDSVVDPKKMI